MIRQASILLAVVLFALVFLRIIGDYTEMQSLRPLAEYYVTQGPIELGAPNIVTGIRTGLGFAWRGLIAAEMIATNVGLGYMLFVARDFYRTEVIVLGMIVIGVLWLLLDRLVLAPLERATIERWGMVQRA